MFVFVYVFLVVLVFLSTEEKKFFKVMRTNVCLIFVLVSKIVRTNVWESLGLWKSESHRQQRPPPRAECKEAGDVTSKMFIQRQADMSSTNWPPQIF